MNGVFKGNHNYRYEAPVGQNRWDSPLLLSLKSRPLDVQQVYDALFSRKAPPPNQVQKTSVRNLGYNHEP